jgi:pimeloyl-ACP methyl ester carboxylesterase
VGRLAITREGPEDVPAIVCIHGIPGSLRDFRYLAPALVPAFQVIRCDMPGFGSSPLGAIRTVDGWAETVIAVADALDIERCMLLAHSFASGSVYIAAHRWPDRIRGIVLLAGMGGRLHRGFGGFSPWMFRLTSVPMGWPLLRRPLCATAERAYERRGFRGPPQDDWRRWQLQVRLAGSVSFARVARIAQTLAVPALIIHAEDDPLVEASIAREMAAAVPESRCLVFPEGGHYLQKTRVLDVTRAIIDMFGA